MRISGNRFALLPFVLVMLLAGALAACDGKTADTTPPSPNTIQPGDGGEKGLSVSLLNYTDEGIDVVYVNGNWAGGMGKHGGGTSFAGSAFVPVHWRKDYKLKISWMTDSMYAKDHFKLTSRMMPLEPYGPHDGGILWVAFFPHDVIRLYVSGAGPGLPEFPARIEYPSIQCVLDGYRDCPQAAKDWFDRYGIPYGDQPGEPGSFARMLPPKAHP